MGCNPRRKVGLQQLKASKSDFEQLAKQQLRAHKPFQPQETEVERLK
jgi:hypothetical protein